jgi:hypothetical protein
MCIQHKYYETLHRSERDCVFYCLSEGRWLVVYMYHVYSKKRISIYETLHKSERDCVFYCLRQGRELVVYVYKA